MRTRCLILAGVVLAVPSLLSATELRPETTQGWDQYIQKTNADMQERLAGRKPFLWIDQVPDRRQRLRSGEVLASPVTDSGEEKVPHGLIHDWIGAVFIPNTTIPRVFSVLDKVDHYDKFYDPTVVNAKLLERSTGKQRFLMVMLEKAPFVTAAIESEYASQKTRVDDRHFYSVTYSTRIQEIADYGEPAQRKLPAGTGNGFIWRLYSIERFEERDGGVYAEFEAIALSRDIPFALNWLVKPIVQHLPRNSMVATLEKTRNAVRTTAPQIVDAMNVAPTAIPASSAATAKVPAHRAPAPAKRAAGVTRRQTTVASR